MITAIIAIITATIIPVISKINLPESDGGDDVGVGDASGGVVFDGATTDILSVLDVASVVYSLPIW